MLMVQSQHLFKYLWDLSLWSVTSESLDVFALLKSGQTQWMETLGIIVRELREVLEGYTLDFPQPRKDCSLMFLPPGRLSSLVSSFVMKTYFCIHCG
jgi:hypothetical protein